MKNIAIYFTTVLLTVFALIFVQFTREIHEEQMQKLEEIQQSIEQRNHLDSLYWNHLENCAFINREEVKVGYQGYLYSTYHRNNIK